MNSQTDAIRDKEMVLRGDKNNFNISKFLDEEWVFEEKARRLLRRAYLYGSPAIPRSSDTPLRKSYLYIATCSKKLAKNLKIEIVFVRNKWGDRNQLY